MYSWKITLGGPSGAGKTTTLVLCCGKNAYLLAEEKRMPNSKEIEAWGSDKPVSTSWYPNYGGVIIGFDVFSQQFKMYPNKGKPEEGDYLINIVDTCGQQPFYKHSEKDLADTHGILFVFDASRDPDEYKLEIQNVFNDLQSLYQGRQLPPIVFMANKQDLVKKWRIAQGGHGRELFYQRILGSHDPFYNNVPFVGSSALEGWGVAKAIDYLMKEIIKRINPKFYQDISLELAYRNQKSKPELTM